MMYLKEKSKYFCCHCPFPPSCLLTSPPYCPLEIVIHVLRENDKADVIDKDHGPPDNEHHQM